MNKCEECKIAKSKQKEILEKSDSIFEAVYDFGIFIDNCKNNCKESEVSKENE